MGTNDDLSRPLYEEPLWNFVRNKDVIYLGNLTYIVKGCFVCYALT